MLRQRQSATVTKYEQPLNQPVIQPTSSKRKRQKWSIGSILLNLIIKFIIGLLIFVYVIIPIGYKLCPFFRRFIIYMNYVNFSPQNLTHPDAMGFPCSRNFYLESEPNVTLGVWHILPASVSNQCREGSLSSEANIFHNKTVVLYLHGSGGNRASRHRLAMYKVLTDPKINAHVVAFDYRGFGDSSLVPISAANLQRDATAVYKWITEKFNNFNLFIWGHSMGTGVAVQVAANKMRSNNPAGVILEAPFTSIADASYHHPLGDVFRFMPYFRSVFVDTVRHPDTNLNSEDVIGNVSSPLLILHAQDDELVAFHLGKKLHERALMDRPMHLRPAEFVEYEANLGYGHKYIYRDPNLPEQISSFMKRSTLNK